MERTRATLLEAIEGKLASCQKELDTFAERFATNPAYAFTWAPLSAAASLTILQSIAEACKADLDGRTEEEAYEHIRAYIEQNAMNHADRVNRSTSATSNLIGDYERVQWVKLMNFANNRPISYSL